MRIGGIAAAMTAGAAFAQTPAPATPPLLVDRAPGSFQLPKPPVPGRTDVALPAPFGPTLLVLGVSGLVVTMTMDVLWLAYPSQIVIGAGYGNNKRLRTH